MVYDNSRNRPCIGRLHFVLQRRDETMRATILLLVTIMTTISIGCGEEQQHVIEIEQADSNTVGVWGAERLPVHTPPIAALAEGVEIVSSNIARSPEIIKQVATDDELKITLSHRETEDSSDEIVIVKAVSGVLIGGDTLRFYAGNTYLGKVKLPSSASLLEIHIRLDNEDLPDDVVDIEVEVSRNGSVIADAELTLNRTDSNSADDAEKSLGFSVGPRFESVKLGKQKNHIILVFSDDVDAPIAIKKNIFVVLDGKALSIWSYGEDGYEITLVMRKDLVPGQYDLIYNGKGGLKAVGGKKVPKFETSFTVGEGSAPEPPNKAPNNPAPTGKGADVSGELPDETVNEPPVWRTIKHGLYDSGTQFLLLLDAFDYVISRWTKEIAGADTFTVEQAVGTTELCRIKVASLGITGTITPQKIYDAIVKSNLYEPLPPETPLQDRMLYTDQPRGESLLYVTTPLERPSVPGKNLQPSPWRW